MGDACIQNFVPIVNQMGTPFNSAYGCFMNSVLIALFCVPNTFLVSNILNHTPEDSEAVKALKTALYTFMLKLRFGRTKGSNPDPDDLRKVFGDFPDLNNFQSFAANPLSIRGLQNSATEFFLLLRTLCMKESTQLESYTETGVDGPVAFSLADNYIKWKEEVVTVFGQSTRRTTSYFPKESWPAIDAHFTEKPLIQSSSSLSSVPITIISLLDADEGDTVDSHAAARLGPPKSLQSEIIEFYIFRKPIFVKGKSLMSCISSQELVEPVTVNKLLIRVLPSLLFQSLEGSEINRCSQGTIRLVSNAVENGDQRFPAIIQWALFTCGIGVVEGEVGPRTFTILREFSSLEIVLARILEALLLVGWEAYANALFSFLAPSPSYPSDLSQFVMKRKALLLNVASGTTISVQPSIPTVQRVYREKQEMVYVAGSFVLSVNRDRRGELPSKARFCPVDSYDTFILTVPKWDKTSGKPLGTIPLLLQSVVIGNIDTFSDPQPSGHYRSLIRARPSPENGEYGWYLYDDLSPTRGYSPLPLSQIKDLMETSGYIFFYSPLGDPTFNPDVLGECIAKVPVPPTSPSSTAERSPESRKTTPLPRKIVKAKVKGKSVSILKDYPEALSTLRQWVDVSSWDVMDRKIAPFISLLFPTTQPSVLSPGNVLTASQITTLKSNPTFMAMLTQAFSLFVRLWGMVYEDGLTVIDETLYQSNFIQGGYRNVNYQRINRILLCLSLFGLNDAKKALDTQASVLQKSSSLTPILQGTLQKMIALQAAPSSQ